MSEAYTAGVLRVLDRARYRALAAGDAAVQPLQVLASLADEEESRAAELLRSRGFSPSDLLRLLGEDPISEDALVGGSPEPLPLDAEVRAILQDATVLARSADRSLLVSTEHLLGAILRTAADWLDPLRAAGLPLAAIVAELAEAPRLAAELLDLPPEIAPLELTAPSEAVDLGRVLDASANRAREGLRVIEDFVRFALDDRMLTRRLKDVRHRVDEAVRGFGPDLLIDARDVEGDVGTHVMAPPSAIRESPRAVLSANFKRAQEALRSLEEYAKLVDDWISGRFEAARYDLYTLEKLVMTAVSAARTLDDARLYVLVGGLPTLGDLRWIVGEALAGGADVIQLREKNLPDRKILDRAREVRLLTAKAGARFVMNDRADLARIAGADGVHLGQNDLTVRDARRIVGPRCVIGVSTHDPEQLRNAVISGAGYLGVGPVFASETKEFASFVGLGLVREAADETTLPWFAIGGIDADNIDEVLYAGASRVAVSGFISRAESPRAATRELRVRLDAH
jgi:thiamine-phosphate pyrophosphorylase